MSVGQLARRVLGDRWFPYAGRAYRRLAVDLSAVVDTMPPLPPDCLLLDVGGGDGDFVNILLERNPSTQVVMIDLAAQVGIWVRDEFQSRVTRLPETSIRDYAASGQRRPDIVNISDVVHHVPAAARDAFFADLKALVGDHPTTLFIKDIEPGSPRARALYMADVYISGDKNVSLISSYDMCRAVHDHFPGAACYESFLYRRNPPNYSLIFSLNE